MENKPNKLNNTDQKAKTGTREWSSKSLNIGYGCVHDCKYCYAREMHVDRFQRISKWIVERPAKSTFNEVLRDAQFSRKYSGVVMFPTTHDISPYYLPPYKQGLESLLQHGNQVLVVSKPHLECIKDLCVACQNYKAQVEFRFTIGTLKTDTAALWEPGAPPPVERLDCLKHAFNQGFSTSVSIEPMLDDLHGTFALLQAVDPYVTGTIWIGKMNRIASRVRNPSKELLQDLKRIRENQSDENIRHLVEILKSNSKVCWKDSIQEVLGNT